MAFLDRMPDAVCAQRDVLRRLLAAVEPDPTWRWVELSCSLARGAGDELSDVDAGIGVADDAWPAALSLVEPLVAGLGEVVDVLHHALPGWNVRENPHRHTFVQYADGVQLSLVAMPASSRPGLPPGAVALLDRDGRLATPITPGALTASDDTRREWSFFGWQALSDLDKYLRRGSLWEARQRLEEAREQVWRLWAAGRDVPYPVFGLTSVLDGDVPLPPRVDETVAGLDAAALRRAALVTAELLTAVGAPSAFASYVDGRLRAGADG